MRGRTRRFGVGGSGGFSVDLAADPEATAPIVYQTLVAQQAPVRLENHPRRYGH